MDEQPQSAPEPQVRPGPRAPLDMTEDRTVEQIAHDEEDQKTHGDESYPPGQRASEASEDSALAPAPAGFETSVDPNDEDRAAVPAVLDDPALIGQPGARPAASPPNPKNAQAAGAEPPRNRETEPVETGRTGIAAHPDPIAPSGLSASVIAAIAYGAVQSYKAIAIGQAARVVPFFNLNDEVRDAIIGNVRSMLAGTSLGAQSIHEAWQKDKKDRGVTVEQDARVEQPWLGMDKTESRKALIFAQVTVSLIRPL